MAKLNELTKEQKIDYLRKNPIFWAKWCDGGDSTNYYSIEDALVDAQKDSDKYATTVKNISTFPPASALTPLALPTPTG